MSNNSGLNNGHKLEKTIKITMGLLVALIIVNAITNVLASIRFEEQNEFVEGQGNRTRGLVSAHDKNVE